MLLFQFGSSNVGLPLALQFSEKLRSFEGILGGSHLVCSSKFYVHAAVWACSGFMVFSGEEQTAAVRAVDD